MSSIGSHKTAIYHDGDYQVVQFHYTNVVKFNDYEIILNTGGWKTATTKRRMNQAAEQFGLDFRVYQKDFDWFVDYKNQTLKLDSGIILTRKE